MTTVFTSTKSIFVREEIYLKTFLFEDTLGALWMLFDGSRHGRAAHDGLSVVGRGGGDD